MTARDSNFANAYEGTLTVEMGPSDLTATVDTTTGAPSSPCYLCIEPTNTDRRDYVFFDGTFTGTTLVTTDLANRYLAGSAAGSGITHPIGAKVRSVPVAQMFEDMHDRIDAMVAKSLFDANTILAASSDDTPAALAVAASRLVGRKASGGIAALTTAELAALFGTPDGTKFLADDGTLKTPASSGTSAMTFQGSQTTAAGTSSTTATDVVTVSGLNIAADIPLIIRVGWSKTGSASTVKSVGLKINSTVLDDVVVSGVITATGVNNGYADFYVGGFLASYNAASVKVVGINTGTEVIERSAVGLAARPNAAVTSVTIRGAVTSGSDTLSFDNLYVYSLAIA